MMMTDVLERPTALHEYNASSLQPFEFSIHIFHTEGSDRDAIRLYRRLKCLGCRMFIRFQQELHAIDLIRRRHGKPTVHADRQIALLPKTQHIGVECECLCLIINENA
jgi:hypothetical protein